MALPRVELTARDLGLADDCQGEEEEALDGTFSPHSSSLNFRSCIYHH